VNRLSGRGKSEENKGREQAKRGRGGGEGKRGRGKASPRPLPQSMLGSLCSLTYFGAFSPTVELGAPFSETRKPIGHFNRPL